MIRNLFVTLQDGCQFRHNHDAINFHCRTYPKPRERKQLNTRLYDVKFCGVAAVSQKKILATNNVIEYSEFEI